MSITALNRILDGTGPIKFLGCSVISFTANAGWGNDNSTFSVELVEDCEVGDRFWGRDIELIGTAKYFDLRIAPWFTNFAFGGIVTSWTENKGTSGQTFTVNMSDPKQLLSGVTLITDSYSYVPYYNYNFYNPLAKYEWLVLYGFCSEFGKARSDQKGMNYQNILKALLTIGFEDQGDPWGRFACVSPTKGENIVPGSADFVIDIGLTWDKATNKFTATRVDHLPIGPDYYKVAGSENLLDLFNNVCELTGRNLLVQLDWDPVLGKNVIVVRCIHLVDTFAGNYDTLVNTFDGVATQLSYGKEFNNPKTRNMILGDNVSYLNQATTFTPCFGFYTNPAVIDGVVVNNRYPIAPRVNAAGEFLDPSGNTNSKCGFWILADISKLQYALFNPLMTGTGSAVIGNAGRNDPNGNPVKKITWTPAAGTPVGYAWISEADLQAALSSEALWRARASAGRQVGNTIIPEPEMNPGPAGPGQAASLNWHMQQNYPQMMTLAAESIKRLFNLKQAENVGLPISDVVMNTGAGQQKAHDNQLMIADLKAIYNFVLDLAQTHYGKTFVFKMNERICAHFADPESDAGALIYSSEPTNEGGWIDPGYTALGLSDPALTFFRTDDGRVECFARWNGLGNSDPGSNNTIQSTVATPYYSGILDISHLDGADYLSDGSTIWMKGSVDGTVYFVSDLTSPTGYSPAGIITFSSPAFLKADKRLLQTASEQALSMLYMLYTASAGQIDPNVAKLYKRITQVSIVTAGSGYAAGEIDANGGGGTGGKIKIGVDSNGGINSVSIANGGENYTSSFTLNVPGAGNGGQIYVSPAPIDRTKYCGIPSLQWNNNDKIRPRTDNPGYLDINHKGIINKMAMPDAAAIPMKSNVMIYGPFFSTNFFSNYGGVNVEQDKDLAPWNFGSLAAMIIAGDAKAQTAFEAGQVPLVISENGNLSIPGLPLYMLGSQVIIAGVAVGPIVNSVSVSFGSQGISTNYDFKTFSRKFGNLTAIQTEHMKQIAANKQKNLKFFREAFGNISQLYRKLIRSSKNSSKDRRHESVSQQNTTHRIFVGENTAWTPLNSGVPKISGSGERPVVVMEGLDKLEYEVAQNYSGKAFISLDGMYSSVSVSGDGKLPRFPILEPKATLTPEKLGRRRHSVNPIPPVIYNNKIANAIDLAKEYFNPFLPPYESGQFPYHSGKSYGHCVEILGREDEVPLSGLMNSMYPPDGAGKYSNDYRFVSHRGPMVLHQWGYDTQGKPVPNRADDPKLAASGIYKTGELTEQFMQDWLQKPSSWPVAPVDLRFDRARGMWVAPPEYKIAVVEPVNPIAAYSTGIGRLVNSYGNRDYGNVIVDENGNKIPDSGLQINLEDRLGQSITPGQKAYAYFDTFTSTYLLLGGGSSIVIGKFCNQWPSLSNVKDPANAVKKVALYTKTGTTPWSFTPLMETINGVQVPKTVDAINLFTNVAAHEYQTKWCALGSAGGTFILLAAEA